MSSSVVYLDNLPTEATLNEIFTYFGKYGSINRVKFPLQHFDSNEVGYSAGIAILEFATRAQASALVDERVPVIIRGHVVHAFNSGGDIRNRIKTSLFIFFASQNETSETISKRFSELNIVSCQIFHNVLYGRHGMAVIQFRSNKDKDSAYSMYDPRKHPQNDNFIVRHPDYEFEVLDFDDDDSDSEEDDSKQLTIEVTPPSYLYSSIMEFDRWYDFEILHCNKTYRVNKFVASSFSRKVLQCVQEQIESGYIQRPFYSEVTTKGPYELVIQSLMGHEIQITAENVIFLMNCAKELQMDQLTNACLQVVNDMTNKDLVIRFAGQLCEAKMDYSKHVEYIAKNFKKLLDDPSIKLLPLDVIVAVLKCVPDKVKKTQKYADWIQSCIEQDSMARAQLISFVPFDIIDYNRVRSILSRVGVNMNQLKGAILRSIINGFNSEGNAGAINVKKCPYNGTSNSEGIFARISKDTGYLASKTVEVTGTSDIHMIIDPSWKKSWVSPSIQDMWIMFDLDAKQPLNSPTARTLYVTSYTIKTTLSNEPYHLKNWKLEGSNDLRTWTMLHEMNKNCVALKGSGKEAKFDTNKNSSKVSFRYLKLTQTGPNWANTNAMCLQAIEFYGEVYSGEKKELKKVINFEEGKKWCGFFDYLTRLSVGNPVHTNEVRITTGASPAYLVDKGDTYWRSPDLPNSFVMFSFPNMSVSIEAYQLECNVTGHCFPVTWELEGSDDGVQWHPIDSQKNNKSIGDKKGSVFVCIPSKKFKKIRFKQTGVNNAGRYALVLSHIEFFGSIYEFESNRQIITQED